MKATCLLERARPIAPPPATSELAGANISTTVTAGFSHSHPPDLLHTKMSRQYKMEGPDVSQYEDHETVAREWSTDKIYNSCIFGEWQDEGPIIFASGYEDSAVLRLLLKRIELLPDKDD